MRSKLLRLSIGLHLGAAGLVVASPPVWPWALSTIVVDHLLLLWGSLWPRSAWVGPNLTRLPPGATREVALTFDDGPDPQVTPAVLDLLERHGATASFFCIGSRAERNPELIRAIVEAGHRVENHSYRHSNAFSLLGPRALRRELDRAQTVLTELTRVPPVYFRAPAGIRNPWLDGVLESRGLALVSWTRRGFDTFNRDPARVARRLLRGLAARDVLLLHDGSAARDRRGSPVVLQALPRLLERIAELGLRAAPLPRPRSGS